MDKLIFFIRSLLEAFPYILLQTITFRKKTRLPPSLCVIIQTLLMSASSFSIMLAYDSGSISRSMLLPLRFIQLFILLALNFLLIKEDIFKILFTFFAIFPYMSATGAVSVFIAQLISEGEGADLATLIIVQTIVTVVAFYPVYLLWKKLIMDSFGGKNEDFWKSAFVVPLSISIVNILSMESGGFATEMSVLTLLEQLAFLSCVISCSTFSIHIREFISRQVVLEERAKRDMLLIEAQEQQYNMLSEYIETTRSARHDFKHQIIALRSLCENNEYDKVAEYLNSVRIDTPKEVGIVVSPNKTVNAVFDYYLKSAKRQGITIKIDMQLSRRYGLADSDICILFGNILENAIEGCLTVDEPDRFIEIRSAEHAGRLYLTFDNSFDGKYRINDSGVIMSRKRDWERSGVGVRSIRAIVEKYGGTMNIEVKENVFCLSIAFLEKD